MHLIVEQYGAFVAKHQGRLRVTKDQRRLAEVIRLMMTHKVKRLPVVDTDGRALGMVGRAGVLAALSHSRPRGSSGAPGVK